MSWAEGLVGRPEPVLKCPACTADIPLSSGWGPVGDKQFRCSHCGELCELRTAVDA
jgi:transposase-like protein